MYQLTESRMLTLKNANVHNKNGIDIENESQMYDFDKHFHHIVNLYCIYRHIVWNIGG